MKLRRLIVNSNLVFLIAALGGSASCLAESDYRYWFLQHRFENTSTKIDSQTYDWQSSLIQAGYRFNQHDAIVAIIDRQSRGSLTDTSSEINLYKGIDDWQGQFQVQHSDNPHFIPKHSISAQLQREIGKDFYFGFKYREMRFTDSTVTLLSPIASYYHGNYEYNLEYDIGRNEALQHNIRIAQFNIISTNKNFSYGLRTAFGKNLFDTNGIIGSSQSGWSASLFYKKKIYSHWTMGLEFLAGSESEHFTQKSTAISLQYQR